MTPLFSRFDWKISKPHLELMSKFLKGNSLDAFRQNEYWLERWKEVLKEDPEKVIQKFINEKYLVEADLDMKVDHFFNQTELKRMCQFKNLSTKGKKADLLQRLIEDDETAMRERVQEVPLFKCSEKGLELVQSYLSETEHNREQTEDRVLTCLKERNFSEAARGVVEFEKLRVFGRDSASLDVASLVDGLNSLFEAKPDFVNDVPGDKLDILRLVIATAFLWGRKAKLPDGFGQVSEKWDNQVCLNQLTNYTFQRRSLSSYYANADVVAGVQIFNSPDACEECKKLAGKTYFLEELIPSLPNPHCTHKKGCRCCYIPITIGNPESRR